MKAWFARRPWLATVVVALAGGGALGLAHSRLEVWPLGWLGPAAIVLVGLGAGPRQRLVGAVVLAGLGTLGLAVMSWEPLLAVAMILAAALVIYVALVLVGLAGRRLAPLLVTLAYPAVAVAAEFAMASAPLGTAMSGAYAMHDSLVLLQLAAVTGPYGLSFLAAWFGSVLGLALWQPAARAWHAPAVALVAVVGAVIVGGTLALRAAPAELVTVAAVHAPTPAGKPEDLAANRERVAAYAPLVHEAASAGAGVVVWPEMILSLEAGWADSLMADLADLARGSGAWQVIGFYHRDDPRNTARVLDPAGSLRAEYQKIHLVAAMERSAPGRDPAPVVATGVARLGVLICNDDVFTDVARQLARDGAQLVADPTWDWRDVAWRHAQMTRMRAAEGRVAYIRATQGGSSQLIDPWGRVLAEHSVLEDPRQVLVGALPLGTGDTFYARFGDVFAWAVVVLLLGLVLGATVAPSRPPRLP